MTLTPTDFIGNIERFSGFADLYDQVRPKPPDVLGSILVRLAQTSIPDLVVDLGSGTGLSSRYWADRAHQVIGIEPSADMRHQAEAQTSAKNISYREGFSHQTGLPDRCAQVITCSQALHWMDPQTTFEEAARVLVLGGVFAAFDYDWPPETGIWEADAAYIECMLKVQSLQKQLKRGAPVRQWDKEGHLSRMKASHFFRYTNEIVVHHVDQGNPDRFVGILLSQGSVQSLIKSGVTNEQAGIDTFRETAHQVLGAENQPWYWSCRLRFGVV